MLGSAGFKDRESRLSWFQPGRVFIANRHEPYILDLVQDPDFEGLGLPSSPCGHSKTLKVQGPK